MITAKSLGALITAMITPFDAKGAVDLPQMQAFAERQIAGGVDTLLVCGTTGESPTVCYEDKLALFKAVCEVAVPRQVAVIANVGDNSTADTVAFAKRAVKTGVDALMCVVPYYNKPPQEGLYRHFKAIAQAVPETAIVLYNIPGRSVINMEAMTTLRLARDCPNIVAIKEASGKLDQIKQIIEGAPADFRVFSGEDSDTLEIMRMGGAGVISTASNVAPQEMRTLVDSCAAADWPAATTQHERLLPLMKGLFVAPNPIMVKAALALSGFPVGGLRLPLIEADSEQRAELSQIMAKLGLLA
ncbi:MAG: 4-hydroxy-tetrahydrodipicolinate synthase [Coriobacteriales bacterium]|jgi:4-hydroxy-tetrahydrodipicolinate synthase|nr:4-hydroxy-tetrahydrodipicolinate synthase [Coriobacteriales bacterium]